MTVSLDSPLGTGPSERRQRIRRTLGRAAGFVGKMARNPLTAWPPIARLARAETLSLRQADFISAVRLQGASPVRVLWRHIVPLCLPSVIIRITMNMAGIILTAAGLGFLGLGAQPPEPEWGAMISSGRTYMMECWWVVTIPGLAILINSLAFNFLGDGLRDILDPRSE
ncbi:ABC transporter permease [Enterobacter hormaechei]|nr:ABC transporter permease [Enterobacter hormaechei]EMD5646392.1 ABC transporter permease [Enterobacter hormaechei]HBL5344269.1 ABC transporter permease [Enterobacter hormaechei]HBL9025040.1 ABC transporter permease [Enterobacter hormaechei]HBL9048449.1 ABC transporter permease [Enterobacter hormaechei]HBL9057122.1 ABC transporter permease [Enterobacter hormaechei]